MTKPGNVVSSVTVSVIGLTVIFSSGRFVVKKGLIASISFVAGFPLTASKSDEIFVLSKISFDSTDAVLTIGCVVKSVALISDLLVTDSSTTGSVTLTKSSFVVNFSVEEANTVTLIGSSSFKVVTVIPVTLEVTVVFGASVVLVVGVVVGDVVNLIVVIFSGF